MVNSGIKLQLDKVTESSGKLMCYFLCVEDMYVHHGEGKLESIDM